MSRILCSIFDLQSMLNGEIAITSKFKYTQKIDIKIQKLGAMSSQNTENSVFEINNPTPKVVQAQRPSSKMRFSQRNQQIQNMKKSIRYNWSVQQTIQYLQKVDQKIVQSQQIILQAIENQNTEYLVQLIVTADALFKTAVLGQKQQLFQLIQSGLSNRPSAILLLGNLCALYPEYIKQAIKRDMIQRVTKILTTLKSTPKSLQLPLWTLSKLTQQPTLLPPKSIISSLPDLSSVITTYLPSQNPQHRQLQTHLYRILSQYSSVIVLQQSLWQFMLGNECIPKRQVDLCNYVLMLKNYIEMAEFSQNVCIRVKTIKALLSVHPRIRHKLPKQKCYNLHNMLNKILRKSQQQVTLQLIKQHLNPILIPYQYSSISYLSLLQTILQKLPQITQQFIDKLRQESIIDNLVHDICDNNKQIGYKCLCCMNVVVVCMLSNGYVEVMDWVLRTGLQEQLQQFIQEVGNHDKLKTAERLLDMIRNQ